MQVILPQTDIETALENFARSILNIRDGMIITIDLKAGRGANGFEATLDISPAGSSAKAEPKAEAPAPVARTPKTTPIIEDKTPVADVQPNAQVDETVTAADTAIAADGQTELGTDPVAEPEPKKGSLFANIKKPVNS